MILSSSTRLSRVYGDSAVIARLEKLGPRPRSYRNLVGAGFPEDQLGEACRWFVEEASTPVEVYASYRVKEGFIEDETLLTLFCRYFECTDWKLEYSPWFFSPQDYEQLLTAMVRPIEFETARLQQLQGEREWSRYFRKLPFDLGLDKAKVALWEHLGTLDYYWRPQQDYLHVRAAQIFRYLRNTLDPLHFSPERYNYYWERQFREGLHPALKRFEEALAAAARFWQEAQEQERQSRFRQRRQQSAGPVFTAPDLVQALAYMGLTPQTADMDALRRSFRRLSKQAHPDHGGSQEEFQRLSRYKDLVEQWLTGRSDN